MKDGIIVINKGEGISSHSVIGRVKRLFGIDKAGHTGTLDPMATGVLPVLLGRAVKASEYMLSSDKHYIATLRLGITTDTEDITGKILSECDKIPSEEEVMAAAARFKGKIMQTPPMYSALKVGGKKLYELARRGEIIEREAREITVFSLDVTKIDERRYSLDVHCSGGTYIRTLCKDIGEALGVGGVMETLCRAHASVFELGDSHTLEALEGMSAEEREALIIPVERVFEELATVALPPFFASLAHSGLEIYLKKISLSLPLGTRVRLYDAEGFFALGEVREFEAGAAIKPIKQFRL